MVLFSSVIGHLENVTMLSDVLLNWNMSDKSQRFGQYVASNTNLPISSDLFYEVDSYKVCEHCCDLIEGFYSENK